ERARPNAGRTRPNAGRACSDDRGASWSAGARAPAAGGGNEGVRRRTDGAAPGDRRARPDDRCPAYVSLVAFAAMAKAQSLAAGTLTVDAARADRHRRPALQRRRRT